MSLIIRSLLRVILIASCKVILPSLASSTNILDLFGNKDIAEYVFPPFSFISVTIHPLLFIPVHESSLWQKRNLPWIINRRNSSCFHRYVIPIFRIIAHLAKFLSPCSFYPCHDPNTTFHSISPSISLPILQSMPETFETVWNSLLRSVYPFPVGKSV